jgi:two-component system NtrC family sensor kinase
MRLSHKLVLSLTAGIVVSLAVVGVVWVGRESTLIEANARKNLSIMGRSLRPALIITWRREGRDKAFELLDFAKERIRRRGRDVEIRWLGVDSAREAAEAGLTANDVARIRGGKEIARTSADGSEATLFVPITASELPPGALELTQSLARERAFAAESLRTIVIIILGLIAVFAAATFVLLRRLLGRPLRRLTEQARSVAAGDLSVRVDFHPRDELGLVGEEMNRMCERLQVARETITAEHLTRVAILEQLRHADRLSTVGRLAAGIAHEMGTPLNVVIGRAKMIATGEERGDQARVSARIIEAQGAKLTGIIRQLLDFARRQVGPKIPTDVALIVRQAVDLLTPLADRRGVAVSLEVQAGLGEVIVERTELEQVLTNIMTNGIQATHAGGMLAVGLRRARLVPPAEISGPQADYLCIEVRDDGDGIADASITHVFDPFFTTKGVGEGTGLGLSVAYGIIRDHGGWIEVDSAVGHGSRFVVNLPVAEPSCGPAS